MTVSLLKRKLTMLKKYFVCLDLQIRCISWCYSMIGAIEEEGGLPDSSKSQIVAQGFCAVHRVDPT